MRTCINAFVAPYNLYADDINSLTWPHRELLLLSEYAKRITLQMYLPDSFAIQKTM